MKLLQENWPEDDEISSEVHWFPVICLSVFLCASAYSLLASQFVESPIVTNGILVTGAAILFLPYISVSRRFVATQAMRQLRYFMGFVCVAAVVTAIYIFAEDKTRGATMLVCIFKTGGLCLIAASMAFASPLYKPREIPIALLIFVVNEFVVITLSYLLFGLNFNENAVGNRTSTIGLVCVGALSPAILRYAGLAGSFAMAVFLQCRTSAVATVASTMIGSVEARSRNARFAVVLGAVFAGGLLGVFADDLHRGAKSVAIANLGSNHPVARFFLDDKNRSAVNSDFLDRGRVWKAAQKRIGRRPLLGYGVGTESKRFKARAHNAYLSMLLEGGIPFLIAWIVFYGAALIRIFDGRWSRQFGSLASGRTMIYLLAYMLLSAMVESSGLGSISSPLNLIFLFLFFWTSQWYIVDESMPLDDEEEEDEAEDDEPVEEWEEYEPQVA